MDILSLDSKEIGEIFERSELTVALFGLGKMGLPLAAVFADKGAKVIGVDIDEKVVEKINAGKNPIEVEPGLDEIIEKNVEEGRLEATCDGKRASKRADLHIILVPTLVNEKGNVDLDPVLDCAEKISEGLGEGNVVVTEATMPPGTTEELIPVLEKSGLELGEFGVGHAPERTMTGTAVRDITGEYPKILGANDEDTLEVLKGVYGVINKKGTIAMEDITSAEAVKVFEGVYRDVNIGLANELALYCEEKGIDAIEIFEAANTQPYCDIHEPGAGVGGHCIPVYPWFVINQMNKREAELLSVSRKINDHMPYHVVDLLIRGLNSRGLAVKNSNIMILGLTFRGGVREFMKTPAKPVIKELKSLGASVYAYDPICKSEDAERFGALWKEDFEGIDVFVILTDHEEFKDLDLKKIAQSSDEKIIVDGRNVLDKDEVIDAGFVYLRIGGI